MKENEVVRKVLKRYHFSEASEISKQLEGTHTSFRVDANNKTYVLRQYSRYTQPEDLRVQFQFAGLMMETGLKTAVPIPTIGGDPFAQVSERLWALFPWCEGRPGKDKQMTELGVLTSIQGMWIQCSEKLRSTENWSAITSTAQEFRQRKSWAWVVPLDQIPQFVESHEVISGARDRATSGDYEKEYVNQLIALLPGVESCINDFARLLAEKGVNDLPHTVTHGDFTLGNIRINDGDAVVLDFDCFSYEPRITDFARFLNHCHKTLSESDLVSLFKRFQAQAQLSREEIKVLPLMIYAYDLYYTVMHTFLFLEEEGNPAGQAQMVKAIEYEMKACERYRKEKSKILALFLKADSLKPKYQ